MGWRWGSVNYQKLGIGSASSRWLILLHCWDHGFQSPVGWCSPVGFMAVSTVHFSVRAAVCPQMPCKDWILPHTPMVSWWRCSPATQEGFHIPRLSFCAVLSSLDFDSCGCCRSSELCSTPWAHRLLLLHLSLLFLVSLDSLPKAGNCPSLPGVLTSSGFV